MPKLLSLTWVKKHYITLLLLAFGFFIRIYQYLANRSLWADEAMLSLSIVNRSYGSLLEPLEFRQNAPIGFLFLTKLSVQLFGDYEYALRLPSLCFGLLGLLLFAGLVYQHLARYTANLALVFFVISEPLIYYSSEVKQYSGDVTACLLLLGLIFYAESQKITYRTSVLIGLIGGTLLLFSSASIFLLATASLSFSFIYLRRKDWSTLKKLVIVYGIWAINFVFQYTFFLKRSVGQDEIGLQKSWAWKGFFAPNPFLAPSTETFRWYIDNFYDIFISPGGFATPGLAGFLFLTGCFILYQHNKFRLAVLLIPIFLTLVASCFEKYPFTTMTGYIHGGRLLLFLTPMLFILIAEGINYFRNRVHSLVIFFMVCVFLTQPCLTALSYIKHPRLGEEIRPVVEYVSSHSQPDEMIYLYYRTIHQFSYYSKLFSLPQSWNLIRGERIKHETIDQFFEQIKDHSRIWFIFSYTLEINKLEKDYLLVNLDSSGIRLDEVEKQGASAYLYQLKS